ncbi:DNA adenine methylase [Helicobacter cappadocius]|uniref:site-specific DNA-methyltransferase (adenine-specific) n=1 Tax=Helicobacter cappadocius TaxID=3063998 RepID=A0AA90T4G2_9HELI|nr:MULTISPECIES: DNA adenine methylase [unclassified Helicobacter]MDO7252401.1 DNA adenine methylase [Helicobacter sp. faydin-H75]MDP2538268.1 DNA adenine methylase [Helicobacter sp. faydin-H76]
MLNNAKEADFVYFDPPYAPVNKTSSFTSYTKEGFGTQMQIKLKELCDELNNRKVFFMLSNSDTKLINDLYEKYHIAKIFASQMVNSKGKISEVLIKNY